MQLEEIARGVVLPEFDPILDDICMPPYHYREHDDMGTLFAVAAAIKPRMILELGTAHGNTTANLCKYHPEARIVSVNATAADQSGETTTFSLSSADIGRVYRRFGYSSQVEQVFENTLELDLETVLGTRKVDLAIVDACHDKPYVMNDFLKCHPFMSSSGVMLLHDTHPSREGHLAGSYDACVQLRADGHDIRHIRHTWWGVWHAAWVK